MISNVYKYIYLFIYIVHIEQVPVTTNEHSVTRKCNNFYIHDKRPIRERPKEMRKYFRVAFFLAYVFWPPSLPQIHYAWPYRLRTWRQASAAHCSSPALWRALQNTPSPGTGTLSPSSLTSTSPSRDNTTTPCRSLRHRSSTPGPTSASPPERASLLRTFPLFC